MAPKVELIEGFERSAPSLIDYFRSLVGVNGVNGVDGGDGRDAGVAVAVVAAVAALRSDNFSKQNKEVGLN